jgi:putative oxidoreductase
MKIFSGYQKLDGLLATLGVWAQPVLLLAIRLYWGWGFFQTGKGKLMNLEKTTAFFAELNLPWPTLNAIAAGVVEGVGGLLLVVGLASRFASGALIFTMGVAYATAHREELSQIFSDTDTFTEAAPFLFLLASVIVFAFGPGKISADAWLGRKGHATAP